MIPMQVNSLKPIIIGHRGNPGNPLNSRFIENTVDSFQAAWREGADGIELDVHLTQDGELVVYHDDNLGRVFSIPGDDNKRLICNYTLKELYRAELNKIIAPFLGARIPKLEEVLPIPQGKKLLIELKFPYDIEPDDRAYLQRLVKEVVSFIERNNLIDQVYILSFVGSALDEVKKLNPKITTAYNVYQHETDQGNSLETIRALRRQYNFNIINPPFEQVTNSSIDIIHSEGLKIYPWVWKEKPDKEITETERLVRSGVDGTINNSLYEAIKTRNR